MCWIFSEKRDQCEMVRLEEAFRSNIGFFEDFEGRVRVYKNVERGYFRKRKKKVIIIRLFVKQDNIDLFIWQLVGFSEVAYLVLCLDERCLGNISYYDDGDSEDRDGRWI